MSLDEKKGSSGYDDYGWYREDHVKQFIKELNMRLENWEGDLTAQIVKEIEEEVFGKGLI